MLELEVKPERSVSSGRWEFILGKGSVTDHRLSCYAPSLRNAAGAGYTDTESGL